MIDALRARLASGESVAFTVRVRPQAQTSAITGLMADGRLKVDIAAPPEDGEANAELVRLFAETFGVAKEKVQLIAGFSSRRKTVRVSR